ncbi:mitoferrin-2-like [Anneissia japonica]|uniref:mitoferrin-2-like n=1 Tax=Anneissia japonica TaxID=1529436 RepID=UPI001425872D|nr:mitoferrin-2-like [Anneissia japonica]
MDNCDDYEAIPTSKFSTHLLAGAMAGIGEHCIMYPIDCVKTRMQSVRTSQTMYRSVFGTLSTIIQNEGLFRVVRGLNIVALGAGPSHALYFSCYEHLKKTLSSGKPGQNPLVNAVAGSIATLLHDAAMNPVDVVKQRLQMHQSPYKSGIDCMRTIWRSEGSLAFYRSYTTQLTMNIPFQVIHFVTYEIGQETLNPKREYNPKTHVISGGCAGAVAAAATTPLDVCKTLLNTQEKLVLNNRNGTNVAITGMINGMRTLYVNEGLSGFFKGLRARVIFQMPATAISWSVYEFFKFMITKHTDTETNTAASTGLVMASTNLSLKGEKQ